MTVWKLHMIIQKWEESLGRIYIPIKVKGLSMRVYCTEIVYLASRRFFQGISRNGSMSKYKSLLKKRTIWTHTSHTFLLNVVLKNSQKKFQTNKQTNKFWKFWREFSFEKSLYQDQRCIQNHEKHQWCRR